MASQHPALFLCLVLAFHGASAILLDRCEVARRLSGTVPISEVGTWVCIANAESGLRTELTTNVTADGSISHGIFQINDALWCSRSRDPFSSPPFVFDPEFSKGCDMSCRRLVDAVIDDDVECAFKIFDAARRALGGDGFLAFPSYRWQRKCRTSAETEPFVAGCGISD